MSDNPIYVLEREFDAPKSLVWRTWTEPELLAKWYGPGVETVIHKLDVTPGGLWLNEMKMSQGSSYQRTEFVDVTAPDKLVCLMSNADADWNIAANPMMPDWPKTLLTTVTFAETAGKTQMRLTWEPHEATEAERAFFAGAIEGLGKGWNAGMEILAGLLAELKT